MRVAAFIGIALVWAAPALSQRFVPAPPSEPKIDIRSHEPGVRLGRSSFSLPVVRYVAPDGTFKRSRGIIIGREIGRNATVGLGLFKTKSARQDDSTRPAATKSRKVAVGVTFRF